MKAETMEAVKLIGGLTEKYELRTLSQKTETLKKEMNDFRMKFLFVGGFSAGKSALVNAFIGTELLEEGQRPETAIPSEIVYSEEEYVEAVAGDMVRRLTIDDAMDLDTEGYDYLVWHIDSAPLKELGECTIVDMPGFNSGIENHNKAIFRYAGTGNAYILVIDCEEGSIKKNIGDFINEIKNYDNNITIAVSKCDLRTEEDAETVKKNILNTAALLFGKEVPVTATSKFDEKVQEKITSLIGKIDRDEVFCSMFNRKVYETGYSCYDALETYRDSLELDVSEYDEQIRAHEEAKASLTEELSRKKARLDSEFSGRVVPAIMGDVSNVLHQNADALVASLRTGEKNFTMTVNNIIRPVLMSATKEYVEESFDEFIGSISIGEGEFSKGSENAAGNALQRIVEINNKLSILTKNNENYDKVYKTVTTSLAVLTGYIAPWLEIVIIFLPDLLKLIGSVNQKNAMKDKVTQEIIPAIINKLEPEVEASVMKMKDDMVNDTEVQLHALIDNEMESLENIRAAKENAESASASRKEDVDKDIAALIECINKLI